MSSLQVVLSPQRPRTIISFENKTFSSDGYGRPSLTMFPHVEGAKVGHEPKACAGGLDIPAVQKRPVLAGRMGTVKATRADCVHAGYCCLTLVTWHWCRQQCCDTSHLQNHPSTESRPHRAGQQRAVHGVQLAQWAQGVHVLQ